MTNLSFTLKDLIKYIIQMAIQLNRKIQENIFIIQINQIFISKEEIRDKMLVLLIQ